MSVPPQGDSPARIGIIVASMRAGGGERVALNLAEAFVRRGIPTDLILTEATGPLLRQVPDGIRMVDLDAGRARRAVGPLRRYFAREKPSAVLSIGFETNIATVAAAAGLRSSPRLVLSVHSTLSATLDSLRPMIRRVLLATTRLTYARADRLVAVSTGAAQDLARGLRLRETTVVTIHNPVLRDDFDRLAGGEAERMPKVADGVARIVNVGRLTPAKDQATLLRAFAKIAARRSSCLIFVGDGELRGDLEALAARLGVGEQVAFTGYVDNPYPYMRQADLFVLSSVFEGFGNALVEAMAVGTPVVSTDCPHGPNEILDGGKWGRLVAPGDADALAAAMLETLDDGGIDARARAAAFTVERAADRYLELLQA